MLNFRGWTRTPTRQRQPAQSEVEGTALQLWFMYSAQVLDHFEHPRNVGEVEQPDAAVQIENPACGDILKLTMRIVDGRIAEARFLAKGCVPAMACGSLLTEMVQGK